MSEPTQPTRRNFMKTTAAATAAAAAANAFIARSAYASADERWHGIPVGFTCAAWQPNGEQNPVYQTPFQLSFRQSDGRFWVTPTGFLCSIGSSGSPIADGTSGVLTMTGTAPSEPTFTVYGSGSGEARLIRYVAWQNVDATEGCSSWAVR